MRWQQARGVLNALDADAPGSPWWRSVNEDLLRDTLEAKLLVEREDVVRRHDPACSTGSTSSAHHRRARGTWPTTRASSADTSGIPDLAALEAPAERFFMNVVLARVLYAHALVLDADLALGRFAFVAQTRRSSAGKGPQALLSMKDVLPVSYPIDNAEVDEVIDSENRIFRMVDYGVIAPRVDALYAASARALGEPRLLGLIDDGVPAYAWPADQRHVWTPRRRRPFTALMEVLTRPRGLAIYAHVNGHPRTTTSM